MYSGLVVLLALLGTALCDYKCICNYIVERDVHSTPSNDSGLLGYLYEFDCKPLVSNDAGWFAVAYEHKLGYVEDGDRVETQTCPGDYPDADRVTNSSSSISASATSNSTFPSRTNSYTLDAIVPSVNPSVPSSFIASSSPMPSTHAPTVRVTQSALQVCEQLTHHSSTAFADSNFCYELVTDHQTFVNAERNCMTKGGHLAHIQSIEEQKFLTKNTEHYVGDSYIWIGLQDTGSEEHFLWTSGEPLSFSNWYPFRKDFFLHGIEDCVAIRTHNVVSMYNGEWEDLPCNRAHSYLCQFNINSGSNIFG